MVNSFQARFDAMAGPAFKRVGIADSGTFQHGTDDPIDMDEIYVDEAIATNGFDSTVHQVVTTIRLFKRFGIPEPTYGDVITVNPDTDATEFKVDSITQQDASSYSCIVTPA